MIAVGVDGWRDGWVAVVLEDGAFRTALVARRLDELVASVPEAEVFGVDIPIGLPERGRRVADAEAKRFVGPRHRSVFYVEPRVVWEAPTDAEARAICLALEGHSVPSQTLALRPKVLEADALAKRDGRLREVHPEVSFAAIAEEPLVHPKSSWAGIKLRTGLLDDEHIVLPDELGDAGKAGADDVLDAGVAAWSATRIARGTARSLPEHPTHGADGLVAAIWY